MSTRTKKAKPSRELTFPELLGFAVAGSAMPSADDLFELLENIRSGRDPVDTSDADPGEWARHVRSTKRAMVTMYSVGTGLPIKWETEGYRCIYSIVGAGLASVNRLTPDERETAKKLPFHKKPKKLRLLSHLVSAIYGAMRPHLTEALASTQRQVERAESDLISDLVRNVKSLSREDRLRVLAVARTISLCWICTGHYPSQLLRRARQGDCQAADDLLRVDRRVFYDPGIQLRFRRELSQPKSRFVRAVLRGMQGVPRSISKRTMKARMAVMVKTISDGSTLFTEATIRAMYDGITKRRSGGHVLIDMSLPDTPDALRKAIQREAIKWNEMIQRAVGHK